MRLTRITLCFLALVIGLGFYQLLSYLLDDVDAQTLQATEEVMVDTAHIFAAIIEADQDDSTLYKAYEGIPEIQISAQIYKHLKTHVGLNIYITDQNGIIIFDSKHPERKGLDFSEYNDVKLTLTGKYGARSTRTDEKNETSSIMYVAAPIRKGAEITGSLTVYKAQADVLGFITSRRNDILFAIIMIGGGILLFTIAVFIWLFQPIGKLTTYANSIIQGERPPLPALGIGKEVNTLGNALHDMRETLEGRKYVENYVSALTHELKSPLAAIKGSAELLAEDSSPAMSKAQQERFIQNILKETTRSESLVSDLVQLAEIERMPHLATKSSVQLHQLCQEVGDLALPTIHAGELTLKTDIKETLTINGDPMILKLAISNLLENSVSFSPKGGMVQMSLQRVADKDGENAVITIQDQGPGLPGYALERAFEHFYSLPRPISERKGTGLGLPLAREAVTLHRGHVTLMNSDCGGCVAQIILPLL